MIFEMGRMLLSLSVVLGLLWVIARVGRGRQGASRMGRAGRARSAPGAPRIEVLGRRSLGRHSSVSMIRAAGRTMVIGQTAQQITVLADCDAGAAEAPVETAPAVAPVRPAVAGDGLDPVPGLAPETGAMAPSAWDALVDRLREMTVRH
ncbi:MAG TPA: flagellar biosynthetic protein FliO [Acidimicrobiales bacterium]|nr:flagellar biosynthetic protein FliO [Acidimicrobiales bacterium]